MNKCIIFQIFLSIKFSIAKPTQPQYVSLDSYNDINAIRETFPPLANINQNQELKDLSQSTFFIIRTTGEDNVHRAMKYGFWTSSSRKNSKLSQAYKEATSRGGSVYLFFTEISNSYFTGVAKLNSDFNEKQHFKYWLAENKWFGLFKIEWLYVKDTDFRNYEQLKQNQILDSTTREVLKPVHDLIDCTELKPELGQEMLTIFDKNQSEQTLFAHFSNMDKIELQCRQERDNNPKFERKFLELVRVFEQIPFSFSVTSYEKRKAHRKQNQMYIQQFYYSPQMMEYYYQQQQGYYYGQQQPFQQQQTQEQFQQTPYQGGQGYQGGYWQKNNGFYQKQQHDQQYDSERKPYQKTEQPQEPQSQQQKQQPQVEEDPALKHVPLQNRFAVKQKKQKNMKKPKRPLNQKYVAKQDYQQDPNFVVPQQQQDSEEESQESQQEPVSQ